jgi:TRAP-type C4-dicarboxylate transport system permease small subunit
VRKVSAILDGTIGLLAFVAGVILIFVLLSVCAEVVMRYFLGRPIIWVTEVSEYSLLYITFLGAAWVLKRERHVKMELVLDRLNPKVQALVNTITSIVGAIICLALTYYGAQVTWDHFVRGLHTPTTLRPLLFPILAVIPLGSFFFFIQFLRRTHGYLERYRAPN